MRHFYPKETVSKIRVNLNQSLGFVEENNNSSENEVKIRSNAKNPHAFDITSLKNPSKTSDFCWHIACDV